jgi:hypothetical protein
MRIETPKKRSTLISIPFGAFLVLISVRWGILILMFASIGLLLMNTKFSLRQFEVFRAPYRIRTFGVFIFFAGSLTLGKSKYDAWSKAFSNGNENSVLTQLFKMDKNYSDLTMSIFGRNISSEQASYMAAYRIDFPDFLIFMYFFFSLFILGTIVYKQFGPKIHLNVILLAKLLLLLFGGYFVPLAYRQFYGNGVNIQSHHLIPYFIIFIFCVTVKFSGVINETLLNLYFSFHFLVLCCSLALVLKYFSPTYMQQIADITMTPIIVIVFVLCFQINAVLFSIYSSKVPFGGFKFLGRIIR